MNKKSIISLLLAALVALTAFPASAEQVRGAALLTWHQDGMDAALYLNASEYDWRNDPDGLLGQILAASTEYTRHGEQEEPCAVMRLRVGGEDAFVESIGETADYARAAKTVCLAAGLSAQENDSLPELLKALGAEEPALSTPVTREAWNALISALWQAAPSDEQAALTFEELYAALTAHLADKAAREALSGYRAEFEAQGQTTVNWAFLLCVLSEALSPSGESYPYLLFGAGESSHRLILRDEQPEYTVRLFVDDECISRLTVREGEDVELPQISGVTWLSSGKNIQSDTDLCGYTTLRVTYRLTNAADFADRLGDLPVEWVQTVLYGHRVRPSVHYIEALSEKQLRVEWSAGANDRVKQEKTIEGKLIFEGETPSPSALPTVEPTATPVPESCTVTFVYPAELGYSEAESRVTVTVPFGGSATPPTPDKAHQKEHYTLTWPAGWENVTADVTIEGVLTPKTYTVRCRVLDAQGKELYAQDHAHVYGTALTLPSFDLPDGQKVEWDNLPDQITGDCEIIGHVVEIRVKVTYRLVALDGTVTELGEETVPYGGNATLPVIEIPDGCEVTWSGTLSGLTEDTVVTGKLTQRHYTVTVQIFDADGNAYYSSTQQVSHGGTATAPAFTVPDDCTFAWDEGTSFENVTSDRKLTGRLTRKAA
ncbi:MAG: hypothetical protein SOW46_00885 [Candidatus Aphodomonas sp.]|nr:hypothetical protein [Candidatus Aphodomonas sp.]